jgi:CspA family cold shock protein
MEEIMQAKRKLLRLLLVFILACPLAALSQASTPNTETVPATSLQMEVGTVKWFNVSGGFGFISRPNGEDVFVTYNSLRRGIGHEILREGQTVKFRVVKGPKGWQAEDVEPVQTAAPDSRSH